MQGWYYEIDYEAKLWAILRRIYQREYDSPIHLFLPECIAFNQSALNHELHEDVMPSSRV